MRNIIQLTILLFLTTFITACDSSKNDHTDFKKKIKEIESDTKAKIKKLPKIDEARKVTFKEGFDPFNFAMNNLSLIKKVHREKGPLESHALEDFVFSGVLIQGGYVEAIFITPDGLFYRGKVGDYIGKKEGRITKIDPMGIVEVTQPKITISGKKSEDKIILDNTRPVFED